MNTFKEYLTEVSRADDLKQWLQLNKRAFVRELKQNAKVVKILDNALLDGPPMSDSNRRFVKLKLIDMVKTITSIGLFAVPGSLLFFPILYKAFPDLLPSSFKRERDRITFQQGEFDRPA